MDLSCIIINWFVHRGGEGSGGANEGLREHASAPCDSETPTGELEIGGSQQTSLGRWFRWARPTARASSHERTGASRGSSRL